jgi:phosphoglucomutase
MPQSKLAGEFPPPELLIDASRLESDYYEIFPDVQNPAQQVNFGTSGHRGSSSLGSFNEAHILAITQAMCEYRRQQGITGPILVGKDTHALSGPAQRTAIEVLIANGIETLIQKDDGFTPTPSISRAILAHNENRRDALADGIVITPSHNPPSDGGFKYNPPNGGPADTAITAWIERRANDLIREDNRNVTRTALESARRSGLLHEQDFVTPYVDALGEVLDLEAVSSAGIRIGVDPLGGAAVHYWSPIADRWKLDLSVVNPRIDPAFAFMTCDHDGKIRMDCSSPYAMKNLVGLKDSYEIAFGNDPDADRHGIVTRSRGLLNPNHYLAVAVHYLLQHRSNWPRTAAIGKTLVSSGLIDRVVKLLDRQLFEVPVGFKWFVDGLFNGTCCFGGEESAGASFLKRNGTVWTTDKDGIILGLLAAEITAKTGRDPGEHYSELTGILGTPFYRRIDAPASPEQKASFSVLTPERVTVDTLAGEAIIDKLTRAPGNAALIGGLKITTQNGWFAARPSGTENLYKVYAESFQSEAHLEQIIVEAQQIVSQALGV